MNVQPLEEYDTRVNGTSLTGYLEIRYSDLVEMFGEPLTGDGYKVDAEWNLEIDGDNIVTIYNYKTGKNYLGANGLNVEDITRWHIGSKSLGPALVLDHYLEEQGINAKFAIS